MNFPLVTAEDIVIREPEPNEHERTAGYRRIVAMYHRNEEMRVSMREENSVRCDLAGEAKRRMKNNILRRLYPNEITRAIYEIRCEFCGNSSIPYPLARDLDRKLRELEAALRPEVK